jgi:hypothetical protein
VLNSTLTLDVVTQTKTSKMMDEALSCLRFVRLGNKERRGALLPSVLLDEDIRTQTRYAKLDTNVISLVIPSPSYWICVASVAYYFKLSR